uniref:Nuclear casein kinase and cyclin-dependent kinase substrate 1a n=1 Tax=Oryzias sinensis TaxID=183150 RepID=A0A8C8DZU4_9TELE
MSRPVRNRKVVNYSQFNESDAEEEYGDDKPKKVRPAPREPKHKRSKNSQDESEDSDDKLSKSKNDSADDFGSEEEENEFGEEEEEGGSDYEEERGKKAKKAKPEKPSKRGPKRKRPADDSDDDKEVSRKRTVRQAASKAASKQREILLGDGGSEDEEHEDQEEPFLDPDESGSDEDFMVEDDDDSDYGRSKKRSKKVIRRGQPDKKEKKSPKPRLKATVTPSPMKGKGKGRRSAKPVEKNSPKEEEEDEEPESPVEDEEEDEDEDLFLSAAEDRNYPDPKLPEFAFPPSSPFSPTLEEIEEFLREKMEPVKEEEELLALKAEASQKLCSFEGSPSSSGHPAASKESEGGGRNQTGEQSWPSSALPTCPPVPFSARFDPAHAAGVPVGSAASANTRGPPTGFVRISSGGPKRDLAHPPGDGASGCSGTKSHPAGPTGVLHPNRHLAVNQQRRQQTRRPEVREDRPPAHKHQDCRDHSRVGSGGSESAEGCCSPGEQGAAHREGPQVLPPRLWEDVHQKQPPEGALPPPHGGEALHLQLARVRLEVLPIR